MHVNVIALVIEDVNADPDILFSREILACVRNALGSRKIDHREIMNALRCFAADDKGDADPICAEAVAVKINATQSKLTARGRTGQV